MLTSGDETVEQKVLNVARERLHVLAEALHTRFGIKADDRLVIGALINEVRIAIDEQATDLVVCGAKGESLLRHTLLGSTAERMLSHTTRPLLVVKQAPHHAYKTVLVPVDFSDSAMHAIQQPRMVAPQARLLLLHLFKSPLEVYLRYAYIEPSTRHQYRLAAHPQAFQRPKS